MSNYNTSLEIINNILNKKDNYGKNNIGENNKINLEIINQKKELEDNYIIEDLLTKLKAENKSYIEENELLLKSKDKTVLIDTNGFYSEKCFEFTHIYTKVNKNYNKILIFNNKNTNINTEELENILNIPNKTIKIIYSNLNHENKYDDLDINKFRFNCLIHNLNYHVPETELKNITTINSKIDHYIRTNKKSITNFNKNNILNNNITYNILNKAIEFEKIIVLSCKEKNPTIILEYIIELTKLAKNLINEIIISNEIIDLLNSVQIIINNSLKLIGIIPRDEI